MVQQGRSTSWLLLLDGLTPYKEAYDLQIALVQARGGGLEKDLFICLEHQPVYTLGRRGGLDSLKVSEEFLRTRGIGIFHVERGGDITYHGPGQLVLYPIMDLRNAGLGVVEYVAALEEIMIRTAAGCGIRAERNAMNRGVWAGPTKLGSVGIAVRRGISFHGLALNVNTTLEHFSWIHPCGLQGVSAASMAHLRGSPMDMDEVRRSLLGHVEDVFQTALMPIGLEDVHRMLRPPGG
jgi:lipoate-protein ligase B